MRAIWVLGASAINACGPVAKPVTDAGLPVAEDAGVKWVDAGMTAVDAGPCELKAVSGVITEGGRRWRRRSTRRTWW